MSKRPRVPRRRHIPGTFRSSERLGPDPGAEAQRIVLYLPIAALDRAEGQAIRAGVDSVQRYCEALLLKAIEEEHRRDEQEGEEARRGRLGGLLAIASDPDYLAEWTASLLDRRGDGAGPASPVDGEADATAGPEAPEALVERPAADVILRHAGLDGLDDPSAFLASLRRGEPVGPEVGAELMRALADLEAEHRGAPSLGRRLSYALHKLAFEGQVLVTEAVAGASVDEATVDLLRLVQEGVDRVLSGEDIRYFSAHDPSAPMP